MNARERFFDELKRAIARGFTLAAVSVAVSCGAPFAPHDAGLGTSADGGGSEDAGTAGGPMPPRDVDGGMLAFVPADWQRCADFPGASPNGPYFGQCCTRLHCYTPTAGTTCASTEQLYLVGAPFTPPLPLCSCEQAGASRGPFASPNGGSSECCYVIGGVSCLGRPLREEEKAVVAAVIVRSDWA